MNKSDLIEALATDQKITISTSSGIVDTILAAMTESLARGEKVEIRGFGSLKITHRISYLFSNPRTGKKMEIKPRKSVLFTVGRELKRTVDDGDGKKK